MNLYLEVLLLIVTLVAVAAMAFTALLLWMGKGSPDVNGEKERDAGRVDYPRSFLAPRRHRATDEEAAR